MRWLIRSFGRKATPAQRALRAVMLVLLLGACAYRVWLVFSFNPMENLWSDPGRHWLMGINPADTSPLAAIDPIGYQLYIGFLAKITAQSHFLIACWTSLLSLVGPWLWYRFLRELLPGRDWAMAGWVILAALPSWSAIYSYFMQETLMLPLLGAALWATWRSRRKRDVSSFVIAVGIWTLAGITRGICIPLAALAMTWVWFEGDRKVRKAFLSAMVLAMVLVPLTGRIWSLVGIVAPHGIGTMNQLYALSGAQTMMIAFDRREGTQHWEYEFSSPALYRPPFEPLSDWRSGRRDVVRFSIDLDHGSRDWNAARETLPALDLHRLLWLTGDNLVLLFFSESWPDTDPARVIGKLNRLLRWIWAPLTLICVLGLAIRWRGTRERLLPALLLMWILVQGIFPLAVNEGRYRKPFEGLLVAQCLLLANGQRRDRRSIGREGVPEVRGLSG